MTVQSCSLHGDEPRSYQLQNQVKMIRLWMSICHLRMDIFFLMFVCFEDYAFVNKNVSRKYQILSRIFKSMAQQELRLRRECV